MDPPPVIVTIRDSRDNIRVLLYSYYTTITGGGPPKVLQKSWGGSAPWRGWANSAETGPVAGLLSAGNFGRTLTQWQY